MKNFVTILAPMFLLSMQASLFASDLPKITLPSSILTVKGLQGTDQSQYQEADLEINLGADKLNLTLQPRMPECPQGFACAQVMPEPIQIELNGVEKRADVCGATVYEAEKDLLAVDGMRQSVQVIDYTTSQCQYFAPVPDTELRYETSYFNRIEGRRIDSLDVLQGAALTGLENRDFDGQLLQVSYRAKQLNLTLAYSGGCKEQQFDLEWQACTETMFRGRPIKECQVEIVRTAGFNDYCEAWLTEDLSFDLSELDNWYILNIHGKRVLVY